MYGLSPFGRNAINFFNALGDLDKEYFTDSMPVNSCRTDIKDLGDKYIMESELPGFNKEDINIDVKDSYITISAEHKAETEKKEEDGKYIRRERKFGSFKRSFEISDVDTNAISAEYKNGILIIDLPKKKPEEPVSKILGIK